MWESTIAKHVSKYYRLSQCIPSVRAYPQLMPMNKKLCCILARALPVLWQYFQAPHDAMVLGLQVCLTCCPGCDRTFMDEATQHHDILQVLLKYWQSACQSTVESPGVQVCLTRCPGCNCTFTDEATEHHRTSCCLCGQYSGSTSKLPVMCWSWPCRCASRAALAATAPSRMRPWSTTGIPARRSLRGALGVPAC